MSELNCHGEGAADPRETAAVIGEGVKQMLAFIEVLESDLEQAKKRIAEVERENEQLKNDPWSSRVTYENVVEQIAACEDPRERDDARKLIEPMLKRDMARKFRGDIKRKVLELQGEKVSAVNYITLNNPQFDGPMNEITGNDNVNMGAYGR